MLFLLNDVVLDIEVSKLASPMIAGHLGKLSVGQVTTLVREVFAQNPRLTAASPIKASRAAVMMVLKDTELNAALFLTPGRICAPGDVTVRFASLAAELMFQLKGIQDRGRLTPGAVNALVWSRTEARPVAAG